MTPDTMSYLMKCTHAIKYLVNMKVGLLSAICLSVWWTETHYTKNQPRWD